jgi:hypothetical protein
MELVSPGSLGSNIAFLPLEALIHRIIIILYIYISYVNVFPFPIFSVIWPILGQTSVAIPSRGNRFVL